MAVFENPANGYTETVGWGSAVLAGLFGVFYLAYRGLWGFALLWVFAVPAGAILMAGIAGVTHNAVNMLSFGAVNDLVSPMLWLVGAMLLPHLLFSAAVPGMLRKKYLRAGWRAVQ